MMNDVLFGANTAVVKPSESVRVQCEAPDCGALLEIEVPTAGQYHSSLIVRCGNCNRLLSVTLNRGRDPMRTQPHSTAPPPPLAKRSFSGEMTPSIAPKLHFSNPQRPGNVVSEGMPELPLTTMHLARPPPLTRARASLKKQQGGGYVMPASHFMTSPPICEFASVVPQQSMLGHTVNQTLPAVTLVNSVKTDIDSTKKATGGKAKKDRMIRHASPYNRFMSQEVKRIKAENPEVDHRKAFKMAASNWARSPMDCQKAASTTNGVVSSDVVVNSPQSITESNDVVSNGTVQSNWLSHVVQSAENISESTNHP